MAEFDYTPIAAASIGQVRSSLRFIVRIAHCAAHCLWAGLLGWLERAGPGVLANHTTRSQAEGRGGPAHLGGQGVLSSTEAGMEGGLELGAPKQEWMLLDDSSHCLHAEPRALLARLLQVHGVVTHDGRRGAMKVQYPGVARSIESDVGASRQPPPWSGPSCNSSSCCLRAGPAAPAGQLLGSGSCHAGPRAGPS